MTQIETWFDQDLEKAVKVQYIDGNVFSQDNNGNIVGVNLYQDGQPVNVSGAISANVIRPDGVTVAVIGNSADNRAWVVLPQSAYAVPGVISVIIKCSENDDVSTLCAVVATVYQSSTDSVVDPGTIIPSVETLIAEIESAVASIPADYSALWESLAPAFSTDTAYLKWQYVTYNGKVYRFTQNHSGTWTGKDIAIVNLGNEIYITRRDYSALSYVYATDVPNGANLNDYTTPGNFRIATAAIANSLSNYPANVGGRLFVATISGSSSIYQRIIATDTREYTRQKSNAGWSAWETTAFPVITSYAFAKTIDENTDIDNITSPGNYKIPTAAVASSLVHYPSSVGGRLTVMTLNGSNSVYQHLIDTNNREYTRQKSNAGWSAWETTAFPVITSYAYTDAIPENADLDTYTIPGNFRISTAAVSRTIANYPSSVGGRVFVFTINGTNSVLQIAQDTEDRIYTRTKSASGWANWCVIEYDTNRLQKIGARSVYNSLRPIIESQQYNIAFANAPSSIDLMNYVGNDQNVHPKVLYFDNGFGGHKYWMAYTPYPYSFDKFENPCVAYSDDGYKWTNIEGNPIDDTNGNGYNSDTHLVYNGSTLECWYRLIDDESATPRNETLFRRTSTDGVTWSNAETVLVNASGDYSKYLSPAVIYENGKYCMWVVNGSNSPVSIDYYETTSIPTWQKIRTITLTYTDRGSNLYPWHLDAIKEDGQYILCVMGRNGTTKGSKWTLFISTSNDNITYTTPAVVVNGSAGWDEYMYRSSIVKVPSGYRIYYSAGGNGNIESNSIYNRAIWGIGITESASLQDFYGRYQ